jgi:hypothetical protein
VRRWSLVVVLGSATAACSVPAVMPDAPMPDARPPSVTITPSSFDFGEYELAGDAATSHTFTIANALPESVDISGVAASGTHAADFTIAGHTCPATLEPAQSCSATVEFRAAAGTARTAELTVTTAFDVIGAPLQGTGIVRTAKLLFDPPGKDLGNVAIGDTSAPVDIAVLNEATAAMFDVAFSGPTPGSFQLVSTDCNTAVVPLHGTCTVRVAFHAVYGGKHVANLTLSAGAAGSWSAGLSGYSSSPFLVSPFAGAFAPMLVGQPEPGMLLTFDVQNTTDPTTGSQSGTLTPTLAGAAAAEWSIESNTCTTLAPQATCSIGVRFAATSRGTKAAELVVTDGTSGKAGHVTLGASAYTVFITTNPQFAATAAGQTASKTFTVTNASDRESGAISLGITGSDFAIATTTCSGTIAAHASCTVEVDFSPATAGAKSATLTASASPGGSHSVTLMGTGQ